MFSASALSVQSCIPHVDLYITTKLIQCKKYAGYLILRNYIQSRSRDNYNVQLPTATRTAETVVNIVAPTVVAELPPIVHSRAYPVLKASPPEGTQSS